MNGNGQHPTDKQSVLERERLYKRLLGAQAQAGSDAAIDDTPQEKLEAIWTQRALQLARVPVEEEQGEQLEVLLIRLGREVLGVEVRYVVEIRQDEPVTRVPRVPSWVVGVTNLRGRILSVVDMRLFLGLPAEPVHKDHHEETSAARYLVEVESPEMELVFQVDDVLGVESLAVSNIQTESGLIHALPPEYLRGVVKQEGEAQRASTTVSILNLNALLTDPRLLINDYAGDEDASG